jgi:predicted enzyme related to lactoylglutathione lyase
MAGRVLAGVMVGPVRARRLTRCEEPPASAADASNAGDGPGQDRVTPANVHGERVDAPSHRPRRRRSVRRSPAAAGPAPPAHPHPAPLLELVPVPVSDIDRAKTFYADQLGFRVDMDVRPADGVRVLQLTPPGSACSITLIMGIPWLDMPAGTLRGLHLVVSDIENARAVLIERGTAVGPVEDSGGVLNAPFADPDGNTWTLQRALARIARPPASRSTCNRPTAPGQRATQRPVLLSSIHW